MITREQHEAIVRTYLQLVDWSTGREDEGMWEIGGFSRDELARLRVQAKKEKTTVGQVVSRSVVDAVERESGEVGRHSNPAPESPETIYRMRTFRDTIRKARVFEIPANAWRALADAASQYAIEDISNRIEAHYGAEGLESVTAVLKRAFEESDAACFAEGKKMVDLGTDMDVQFPAERERANDYMAVVMDHIIREPFPELTPFEACFFAPSEPLPYLPPVAKALGLDELNGGKGEPCCFGILASATTSTLVSGVRADGYTVYRGITIYDGSIGHWKEVWAARGPWFVKALIDLINEHKHIVDERPRGLNEKLLWKKAQRTRKTMMAPVPFYVVSLTDTYVKEQRRTFFPPRPREWSHRWDVRGHEAVRVQRGALPLPEKTERLLRKRGYKIFTTNQPDVDTYRIMTERRLPPKKMGEWLAVLVTWRKAYVKGPEDKPYVPAAHRVTNPIDQHPEAMAKF